MPKWMGAIESPASPPARPAPGSGSARRGQNPVADEAKLRYIASIEAIVGSIMSKASNAEQLVDATIGVAAHLESELEEALAEHRLTRASFLVLSGAGARRRPHAQPARGGGPGATDIGDDERAARAPRARRDHHARARSGERSQRDGDAHRARAASSSGRHCPRIASGPSAWSRRCSASHGARCPSTCRPGWRSSSPTGA